MRFVGGVFGGGANDKFLDGAVPAVRFWSVRFPNPSYVKLIENALAVAVASWFNGVVGVIYRSVVDIVRTAVQHPVEPRQRVVLVGVDCISRSPSWDL
jgi:hypothetical protein